MFCEKCGKEVEENWVKCPYCANVLKEVENKDGEVNPDIVKNVEETTQTNQTCGKSISKRIFWKYILLSFVTCGIYGIYAMYTFTEDVNSLCAGDGKKSSNYIIVMLLTFCTCGIYGFYWWYKQAERLKEVSSRYGVSVKENGTTILCWQIFGSLLCGIGPFVATYIMFDNVNRLALVYNGEKTSEEVQAMGEAHPKLIRNVIIAAGSMLAVAVLLIVITVAGAILLANEEYSKEPVAESVKLSEIDLEDLIGKSEKELEELGFEEGDDYLEYGAFDGAVQITTTDGKVDFISIEDNGEELPAFAGVTMGMLKEDAYALLQENYPEIMGDVDGKMFLNMETGGSVKCEASEGKIYSLLYIELSDEEIASYQQEKEEASRAEYIFPDSNSKYLSEDEVRSVEVDKLFIGRNEIFARHGYIFEDETLKQHFESTSWYEGTVEGSQFDADAVFNDFEKKNAELIKRIEDEINKPAKQPFIGMEGDYMSLNSSQEDMQGRILILDIGENSLQFSVGMFGFDYYFLNNQTAEIIDECTAQATIDGLTTITFKWSDPENMYVTNSGIEGDWMDAATIDIATNNQNYNRSLEFNRR